MKNIFTFVHFIDGVNEIVGNLISYLLIPLVGVIVAEVISRYLFNRPTIWSFELGRHIFGVMVVLSGGYVLRHHGHIRIDVFYSRLSVRRQAIMDVCTVFFFFLFCGVLLWVSLGYAWPSILSQEKSESTWRIVLWPLKSAIVVGALLILLQGIAEFIRNLYIAIVGKGWEEER